MKTELHKPKISSTYILMLCLDDKGKSCVKTKIQQHFITNVNLLHSELLNLWLYLRLWYSNIHLPLMLWYFQNHFICVENHSVIARLVSSILQRTWNFLYILVYFLSLSLLQCSPFYHSFSFFEVFRFYKPFPSISDTWSSRPLFPGPFTICKKPTT